MFYGGGLLSVALLVLWLWSIYDVITTPDGAQRHLPKVAWVFIVLLFWALGALAWIALGRPQGAPAVPGSGHPSGARGPRPRSARRQLSDEREEAHRLSERERLELEKREYYRRMDEELDRRLEEKRRQAGEESEPA